MKANVGVLLLGVFLGWSGLLKWGERAAWLALSALLFLNGKAHPWSATWTSSWDWNWACVLVGGLAFVIGVVKGTEP